MMMRQTEKMAGPEEEEDEVLVGKVTAVGEASGVDSSAADASFVCTSESRAGSSC